MIGGDDSTLMLLFKYWRLIDDEFVVSIAVLPGFGSSVEHTVTPPGIT